jgi:PAS domain S-box-containing protein
MDTLTPLAWDQLPEMARAILDSAGVGILCLDGELRVAWLNRRLAEMGRVVRRDAPGTDPFTLLPALDEPLVRERLAEVVRTRKPARVGHLRAVFGRRGRFLDLKLDPILQGRDFLGVALLVEDVTFRVEMEQRNRKIREHLNEVVEHSADAVVTVDRGGRILSWNPAAADLFGCSGEEALGGTCAGFFPRRGRREGPPLWRRAAGGEVIRDQETTMLHRDGRHLTVSLSAAPLRGVGGASAGASLFIRDVTQRKKLIGQVVQTEKLAALGVLAAGMAHEINNPLTSIMMQVHLLSTACDRPEAREALQVVEDEVWRISEIVNDLLVYSRQRERKRELVDLREVLQQAVTFIQRKTAANRIEVVLETGEGEWPPFRGATNELMEVCLNLLLNAADAIGQEGRILVRAGCGEGEGDPEFLLTVTDDGCGIPESELPKIFDPFYTTKAPGKGTGLGLVVVRQLVNVYGGQIGVESQVGRGTTFTVRLPFTA